MYSLLTVILCICLSVVFGVLLCTLFMYFSDRKLLQELEDSQDSTNAVFKAYDEMFDVYDTLRDLVIATHNPQEYNQIQKEKEDKNVSSEGNK